MDPAFARPEQFVSISAEVISASFPKSFQDGESYDEMNVTFKKELVTEGIVRSFLGSLRLDSIPYFFDRKFRLVAGAVLVQVRMCFSVQSGLACFLDQTLVVGWLDMLYWPGNKKCQLELDLKLHSLLPCFVPRL
jgi:hypothetical protein